MFTKEEVLTLQEVKSKADMYDQIDTTYSAAARTEPDSKVRQMFEFVANAAFTISFLLRIIAILESKVAAQELQLQLQLRGAKKDA